MTVFQEIVVESMNTTKPNHTILVSFFSEDNVLSDELKLIHAIHVFSNFKVTKIERSAFWDTWYNVTITTQFNEKTTRSLSQAKNSREVVVKGT